MFTVSTNVLQRFIDRAIGQWCCRLECVLDYAIKPATPVTNAAHNETLQQFAPLSDDTL